MSIPEDIDFKHTATSLPIVYNTTFTGMRVVREISNGKIWALHDNYPDGVGFTTRVFYSNNDGVTWTVDDEQLDNTQQVHFLFLDSEKNLITFKVYNSASYQDNCRFYKRDRDSGVWTTYDLAIPAQPLDSFTFAIDAFQTSDGTIHIVKTRATVYNTSYTASNLYYWNFKDGVFSSVEQLTFYSGIGTTYVDSALDTDLKSLKIISHNGDLLIFWSTRGIESSITTHRSVYAIKSSNMDIIQASKAWVTGRSYKVGYCVIQSGLYYKCAINHTSGTFLTDLGDLKWEIVSTYTTPIELDSSEDIAYEVKSIRSTGSLISSSGKLYYIYHTLSGSTHTYKLYEDFVNITPSTDTDDWGNWMLPYFLEVAQNDDIVVFGDDARISGNRPSVVVRLSGVWQGENTTTDSPYNGLGAGHTYNFHKIR